MSTIKTFESFMNEANNNNFKPSDFPIGTLVHMDDEVWMVVKPGVRGNNVFMTPNNNVAKSKYVSIAIEFDIAYLNGNVTMLEK